MRYYIKQRVFSWADRFEIYNESGEAELTVRGQTFSIGKKLRMYNQNGAEVAYIRQKLLAWMPSYEITVADRLTAVLRAKIAMFRPKYYVELLNWHVEGDLWAHDYSFYNAQNQPVVRLHKQWMTWGDSYCIDIAEGVDVPTALALAIAIDAAIEEKND